MLKCPHCGTEKTAKGTEFQNQNALNTHIKFHCSKKSEKAAGHEHKYMLLSNGKDIYGSTRFPAANIGMAITAGYTKICECGEVEK